MSDKNCKKLLVITIVALGSWACNSSHEKVIEHITEGVKIKINVPDNFGKINFWHEGSAPCDRAYYSYGHDGYPSDTTFISKLDSLFQLTVSIPQSYFACKDGSMINDQFLNTLADFAETKMNRAFNFQVDWKRKELKTINGRDFIILAYTNKPTRSKSYYGATVEAITLIKDNLVTFSFFYEGNQSSIPITAMIKTVETIRISD